DLASFDAGPQGVEDTRRAFVGLGIDRDRGRGEEASVVEVAHDPRSQAAQVRARHRPPNEHGSPAKASARARWMSRRPWRRVAAAMAEGWRPPAPRPPIGRDPAVRDVARDVIAASGDAGRRLALRGDRCLWWCDGGG